MRIFKSIVDETMLQNFSEIHGSTIINHVANSYDIETAIAFATLFCPEFVEVDGCILVSEFVNGDAESGVALLRQYHKTNRELEMFVNSSTCCQPQQVCTRVEIR